MAGIRRRRRPWVLAYYMSYDNDLDACGPVILDALEHAVQGTSVAATVLVDDAPGDRLKSYAFSSGRRQKRELPTDNSASSRVLESYLLDVVDRFPAARYAVVFLDHGGRVNEMCLDERPRAGRPPAWLSARQAGNVLRRIRSRMEGRFELLFLQQCARASVNNLYNMRDVAAWILGSQLRVGAPNSYYVPVIQWLDDHPESSGLELSRRVMRHDTDYRSYVCIDGDLVAELPRRLSEVAHGLVSSKRSLKSPGTLPPCFAYAGEANYDLLTFFEAAYRRNKGPKATFDEFETWVRSTLVRALAVHPDWRDVADAMCGLSIFVPSSREQRERYVNYPLNRASSIDALWTSFA